MGGMSDGFRPTPSAFEVIHGRPCQCGEHRAHQWPVLEMGADKRCTEHYPAQCRSRDPLVSLTPEQYERARRIGVAQNRTIEQVVCDAMTIAWVRFAAKNGWNE